MRPTSVCVCPARPRALAGRDVAICGGQASVSAGEENGQSFDLIHLLIRLSQCGIAYGTLWLGCDGNAAADRTLSLKMKSVEGELTHRRRHGDLK